MDNLQHQVYLTYIKIKVRSIFHIPLVSSFKMRTQSLKVTMLILLLLNIVFVNLKIKFYLIIFSTTERCTMKTA